MVASRQYKVRPCHIKTQHFASSCTVETYLVLWWIFTQQQIGIFLLHNLLPRLLMRFHICSLNTRRFTVTSHDRYISQQNQLKACLNTIVPLCFPIYIVHFLLFHNSVYLTKTNRPPKLDMNCTFIIFIMNGPFTRIISNYGSGKLDVDPAFT